MSQEQNNDSSLPGHVRVQADDVPHEQVGRGRAKCEREGRSVSKEENDAGDGEWRHSGRVQTVV